MRPSIVGHRHPCVVQAAPIRFTAWREGRGRQASLSYGVSITVRLWIATVGFVVAAAVAQVDAAGKCDVAFGCVGVSYHDQFLMV